MAEPHIREHPPSPRQCQLDSSTEVNSALQHLTNKMGFGSIRTRSGYDTSEGVVHNQSRCKGILKAMVELTRDLCLLLFYTLPGPPKTLRLYWLLFLRMLIYGCEGLILYSLTLTVMVGETPKTPAYSSSSPDFSCATRQNELRAGETDGLLSTILGSTSYQTSIKLILNSLESSTS